MTDYAHKLRVAVGVELREARDRAGLSRARLATMTEGVSASFIAALERGQGNPSFFRTARVASALGMSMAELVTRAEERAAAESESDRALTAIRPRQAPGHASCRS